MSKPGKVLRNLCRKLGVRLTVKRGKKRVYKSIAVLKRQCANKKKKKVKRKRRRKFGTRRSLSKEWRKKHEFPYKLSKQQQMLKRQQLLRQQKNEQQIRRENNDNNNSTDIDMDALIRSLSRLGYKIEVQIGDLIQIQSNTDPNKSYIIDIRNKLCQCRGCMFNLTCSHLKELFPGDPEVHEEYNSGSWAKKFKKEYGREPRDSDRNTKTMKRYNKYWDWYNEMKRIDTTKIKNDDQGGSGKKTYFGRKKINRKRNKMKKEKISSNLKKLCRKHGVRLTVKRKGKRVYKSVKVLKTQCANKKKKKKVKRRRRRRKFGASLATYSGSDEDYYYSDDEEEMDDIFNQVNAALTLQALQRGRQARKKFKEKREKYRKMSPIQQIGYLRHERRLAEQEQEQEALLKKAMKEEVAREEAAMREAENKEKLKNKLEKDLRNLSVNNGIVNNGIIIRPLWSLSGQVKDLTENLSMTETTIEHFVNNIVQRKTEEEARALVKRITEDVNKWRRGDILISDLNLGAYNFGRKKRKKKRKRRK